MSGSVRKNFKDLKVHIAEAIKGSCYRTDARIYNIANDVPLITTFCVEKGVEAAEGLTKIIDKTIKESVILDCDLSVIVKGILIGTFRSTPFERDEAFLIIQVPIKEILQAVYKYKGNVKQVTEGIMAAIVVLSREFKLDVIKMLSSAKEDTLTFANTLNSEFADAIKEALPKTDGLV